MAEDDFSIDPRGLARDIDLPPPKIVTKTRQDKHNECTGQPNSTTVTHQCHAGGIGIVPAFTSRRSENSANPAIDRHKTIVHQNHCAPKESIAQKIHGHST